MKFCSFDCSDWRMEICTVSHLQVGERVKAMAYNSRGVARSIIWISALLLSFSGAAALTNSVDTQALQAFHSSLRDPLGNLNNWNGNDPCGQGWSWIICSTLGPTNTTYVTELRLFQLNLSGTLAPELGNLTQLIYLDVMWNNLTGSIPSTFGKLTKLYLLLLNGNKLTGILPPELGSLSHLNRIQIDQNQISGPVPPTFGGLTNIQHLHMNNNSLNGSIPKELGTLQNVVHILLDNNNLSGILPPELHTAPSLLIIQLDNNQFASNATIPPLWGNITTLLKLSLRNCGLNGSIPDLSNLSSLEVLDLSHNKLTGVIPNRTFPANLTSIDLSNNQLNGVIPASIANLQQLEMLVLKNNSLVGPVPPNLGTTQGFETENVKAIIDLQNNILNASTLALTTLASNSTLATKVWLAGNAAICPPNAISTASNPVCVPNLNDIQTYDIPTTQPYPPGACQACQPITVHYRLKSPGFNIFDRYTTAFVSYLSKGLNLTQDQVVLKDYTWELGPRLAMTIELLPGAPYSAFNQSEFNRLYNTFSNWKIPDSPVFGPYELISFDPRSLQAGGGGKKGLSAGAIAGIVLGMVALAILLTALVGLLLFRRLRTPAAIRAQMTRLTRDKTNPALKVAGVKFFTFEELAKATDQFSESNNVGQGGYGKVYKGKLADGEMVAIKRAQEGSLQGAHEFYTEIELLSRVHHRNLVMLVGYCNDEGEQMLVYEYMSGGTLRDHLSPLSKEPMDFATRLRVALGSARGILYLHTEANPPIFHRDIKASNILLDNRKTAKVADFGLSRLAPVPDLEGETPGHVSTVVKGTPGYLDPEYFLTHKLTDKSDVYSFGVVLLELITGRPPIAKGINIVREVNQQYAAGHVLSMVDTRIGPYPSEALDPILQLAMRCSKDFPDARPSMAEVVRDLEDIARNLADTYSNAYTLDLEQSKRVDPASLPTSYPSYSSADPDVSELQSGTVMHVAPR